MRRLIVALFAFMLVMGVSSAPANALPCDPGYGDEGC